MRGKLTSVDSSTVRAALAVVSITRLGAVAVGSLVAYFVFVVPYELAVLLSATMVGAALVGLVPLAVVYLIVRVPI